MKFQNTIILIILLFFSGLQNWIAYDNHSTIEKLKNQNNQLSQQLQSTEQKLHELEKIEQAKHAQKTAFEQSVNCLAYNVYYEAGQEPYEGMAAVAQVTLNRIHERFRPKTVCGVVYEAQQFSWTQEPLKKVNPSLFHKAVEIAKRFLTKKEKSDIIGPDVTYFHRVDVHPTWADEHEVAAQIGNHIFYKSQKISNSTDT